MYSPMPYSSSSTMPNQIITSGRGYYPNHPTVMDHNGGVGRSNVGPLYQIEFNAIATGKVIAMSKRQLKWRFGYPNKEALDAGKQGTDCRGEEHDVTLIWSVSSGKRMLMSNGRQIVMEIHRGKMFEHTWVNERGSTLKILAHSSEPISHHMGTRQYDLWIDGVSYFTLPKLYEVGLRGSMVDNRIPGQMMPLSPSMRGSFEADLTGPRSQQEEQEDLKRAIQASLEESRRYLVSTGKLKESPEPKSPAKTTEPVKENVGKPEEPSQQVDLLDLFTEPTRTPPPSHSSALMHVPIQQTTQYQFDPFSYDPSAAQHSQFSALPSANYFSAPTQVAPSTTVSFSANSGAYEQRNEYNYNGQENLSPTLNPTNPFDTFSAPTTFHSNPAPNMTHSTSNSFEYHSSFPSSNYDPNHYQQYRNRTQQESFQTQYVAQPVQQPSNPQFVYSQQPQYQYNQQQYQGQY